MSHSTANLPEGAHSNNETYARIMDKQWEKVQKKVVSTLTTDFYQMGQFKARFKGLQGN